MAKPKKIFLPEDADHSGIDITYIKSTNTLAIGGWYDGFVGISGGEMHLADFFSKLGIPEKDCKQAFSLLNVEEFNKQPLTN
jgi:hypothetical protein